LPRADKNSITDFLAGNNSVSFELDQGRHGRDEPHISILVEGEEAGQL